MNKIKILGMMHIHPRKNDKHKHKYICDDCGDTLNGNCGDPRVKISTYIPREPSAVRWVCIGCHDEIFRDHSSHSIFD